MAQQASRPADSVFTLGTVNVSGAQESDAQKAESRIDREQIQLLELNDVGQALQLVPGVQYMAPGGSGGMQELSANVGTLQDRWYLQSGVSYRKREYPVTSG